MTCAIGAYSDLPMKFGKLLLATPAVVLESGSYNLLVGTHFLREYNGIIKLKDGYLSILGYKVPLVATEFPDLPANLSYNTQGALNESPLDVSNDMN
ncbi:hypothetical protein DSO57_1024263 [Entomophthora muscae]|uniref:Uncharacterized protein n=1 Tax=Entomophthora muscae TaxID=34485 RepID=A0ACC2S4X0_9FUNG|nr:hypothetical protein DSO57_1024263 [Entomophthora muscae]